MGELVGVILIILASSGTVWYRVGKLTNEVKHHNLKLAEIEKQLEKLLIK